MPSFFLVVDNNDQSERGIKELLEEIADNPVLLNNGAYIELVDQKVFTDDYEALRIALGDDTIRMKIRDLIRRELRKIE